MDGKSLVGNRHDYYGKIDYETPAFLQQVAADTVKQFSRHEEGRLRRFFIGSSRQMPHGAGFGEALIDRLRRL